MTNPKVPMKRFWNWLKAEWAICRKQAACPHLDADWSTMDECPDCRYAPVFEVAC